jgi:hypothetical protein
MLQPNVTMALGSNAERPTLVVLTNDTTNLLTQLHWPLADLEQRGYMGTCNAVGDVALRMLAKAHKNLFAAYPLLVPPPADRDLMAQITDLIRLAHNAKSRAPLAALDLIFKHHAAELAQTDIPERWPIVRDQLMRLPAND